MQISFPLKITVSDQEVDCTHFSDAQKEFAVSFTKEILQLATGKDGRVVYGICGPSGSGKSVLATLASEIAGQIGGITVSVVSIDAFHFPNTYLSTHNSGEKTLKDWKGRYDTYDVALLEAKLKDFSEGRAVSFPTYSRKSHDPIPNALVIQEGPHILIVEGLWLLYDRGGWESIRKYLSSVYFLDGEPERLRKWTESRHMLGGRSKEDAERQYNENDEVNHSLVLQTKNKTDRLLVWPA